MVAAISVGCFALLTFAASFLTWGKSNARRFRILCWVTAIAALFVSSLSALLNSVLVGATDHLLMLGVPIGALVASIWSSRRFNRNTNVNI